LDAEKEMNMTNNNPNHTVFTPNQDEDDAYNYEDDRQDALTGDNKASAGTQD
jgi:hypothetical protein